MKRWILLLMVAIGSMTGIAGATDTVPGNEIRFAVFSDPHVYDNSLGTTGEAFEQYLAEDRKMIRESEAILAATVDQLIEEDVDFVLVPGDLTKDGELRSHILFQQYVKILEKSGIPVFPICGNHDINNPVAFTYDGEDTMPVENTTPLAFRLLHRKNAYGRAIYKDLWSLSYVVEPVEDQDLWIVAIDSCKYRQNDEYPETGGAISWATLQWLKGVMAKAAAQGKTVFAIMHHGALEHFPTQSLIFDEYVIDNWRIVSKQLAGMGINVVFTGHFHAQDIVGKSWTNNDGSETFLFDIETGSLVSAPEFGAPYRLVTYSPEEHTLFIKTQYITEIEEYGGDSFPEYASKYLYDGILGISTSMLTEMFGLSEKDAGDLAPFTADAFLAHYKGDEQIDSESASKIQALLADPDPIMKLLGLELHLLWTDSAPADNTVTINLTDGHVDNK